MSRSSARAPGRRALDTRRFHRIARSKKTSRKAEAFRARASIRVTGATRTTRCRLAAPQPQCRRRRSSSALRSPHKDDESAKDGEQKRGPPAEASWRHVCAAQVARRQSALQPGQIFTEHALFPGVSLSHSLSQGSFTLMEKAYDEAANEAVPARTETNSACPRN